MCERESHPFRRRNLFAVMLSRRLMGVPMIMKVGIVLVDMGMFADDVRMRGREFLAEPLGDAGQVENAEKDEHEADSEFHGESDARGNHDIKKDDGGADEDDGDGVTESPVCTDESGAGEGTLAAYNRRDGDDVIGIGSMAHAEKEADRENGKSAEHGECSVADPGLACGRSRKDGGRGSFPKDIRGGLGRARLPFGSLSGGVR